MNLHVGNSGGRGSTAPARACTPVLPAGSRVKEKHAIRVTWAGVS